MFRRVLRPPFVLKLNLVRVCVLLAVLVPGCVPRDSPERNEPEPSRTKHRAVPGQASPDPVIVGVFEDQFQRKQLGSDWLALSDAWKIENGKLCVQGAKNHPIWLRRRLPRNAIVQFNATSSSTDGDIKAEIWGDGRSAAAGVSYDDATGYLAVFGGWRNQLHVLARLDEHGSDRQEIKLKRGSAEFITRTVIPHQMYRFRVERSDGKTVQFSVNGHKLLTYSDDKPLFGEGHEHFGFNDWQVGVCFDKLSVTSLPD